MKRLPLELLKQLSQVKPCSSFYSVSVKTTCKYNDTFGCFWPEKEKVSVSWGMLWEYVSSMFCGTGMLEGNVSRCAAENACIRVSVFAGVFSGGRTCPITCIPDSSLLERPVKLQSRLCQNTIVLLRVQRFRWEVWVSMLDLNHPWACCRASNPTATNDYI